jgi:hypothetical protein
MSEDMRESQARDQECLVLFEKHPHIDAYKIGGSFSPYAIVGVDKRFTDSELAAEYWAAEKWLGDVRDIAAKYPGYQQLEPAMLNHVLTFHRFATSNHFDE